MIRRWIVLGLVMGLFFTAWPPLAPADEKPALPAVKKSAAPEPIRINPKTGKIEIDAQIGAPNRELEYLLVSEGQGPAYESLLISKVTHRQLGIHLILIGQTAPVRASSYFPRGTGRQIDGEKVDIWVTWTDGKKVVRKRIEELLQKTHGDKRVPVPSVGWTFLPALPRERQGGPLGGDGAGGATDNPISLIHDPHSALTYPASTLADPGAQILPHPEAPKQGTPVTLILEPVSETTLAKRELARQADPALKKLLAKTLDWARALDKHRAAWKAARLEVATLTSDFEAVANDPKRLELAQAVVLRLRLARRAMAAAELNVVRDQAELAAERLTVVIAQVAKAKPLDEAGLAFLKEKKGESDEALVLLRLRGHQQEASYRLAKMYQEQEALEAAQKHEEAATLRVAVAALEHQAELYDLQINIEEDRLALEQAKVDLKNAEERMRFYGQRLEASKKELDKIIKDYEDEVKPPE